MTEPYNVRKDWCYACKHCVDNPDEIPDELFDRYLTLSEYHDHVIYCKKFTDLETADDDAFILQRESCPFFEEKEQKSETK